jgi:Matrixin
MKTTKKTRVETNPFELKAGNKTSAFELKTSSFLPAEEFRHVYNEHVICVTDSKGYSQPDNKDISEIRIDASNGFIPLWDKDVSLNWRFNESISSQFKNPEAAKAGIRKLFGDAIVAWKEACPIKFHEDNEAWDFEIAMHNEDCDNSGCVVASSFFPDQGQHTFYIYPTMFQQTGVEQKETIEHEMGHIFGLRHFFANITEKDSKSELFGSNSSFSIMNYGKKSKLKPNDINDLKRLYHLVWSGELTEINGTKIKKFISYHMSK